MIAGLERDSDEIRTQTAPRCVLCGRDGELLYVNLEDYLFNVPGKWAVKKCPSEQCGLIWLDPRPIEVDLPRLYEQYYTHAMDDSSDSWLKKAYGKAIDGYLSIRYGYRISAPTILERVLGCLFFLYPVGRAEADARLMGLPVTPGGRVLEVGFGNSGTLLRLQRLGWTAYGVDFDPIAVGNARAAGLNVILGDLVDANYPDNAFDAVIASHVIEHVSDPGIFLRECRRVLRPDGCLVLYTPNAKSVGHRLFKKDWRGLEIPRHLYLYDMNNLQQLAQQCGFEHIRCTSTCRGGSTLMASILCHMNGRVGLDRLYKYRVLSELLSCFSWVIRLMDKSAGEEISLKAIKVR